MSTKPTLKEQLDPDTGVILILRACSSCHHFTVPTDDTRKMCQKCRNKNNERARAKAQVKAQAKALLTAKSYDDGNFQLSKVASTGSKLKRKSETTSRELEGGEQQRAVKKIKASISDTTHKTTAVSEESRVTTAHTEYQKASLLYDAIKSVSARSRLCKFAGCHSIVKCETINHHKRAKMVVRDLRKIVKLPFKYDKPLKSVSSKTKAQITFSCTCKSFIPETLSSLTNSSGWKSSAPASVTAGNEDTDATETTCGGSVVITVRNDDSHPLSIPGQQIIVEIIH